MTLSDILEKVTDPYERKARVYPALLTLFPVIAMVLLLYGGYETPLTAVLTTGASCGGIYLISNVCREFGKRLEIKLFAAWGGKPSTQMLRHRDRTIDRITKQRYHSFLALKIARP